MRGLGTAVNVVTVLAGSGTGVLLSARLPERARTTVLHGVGLVTVVLGVSQALDTHFIVFPLVAIVLGGLCGEALTIEERLERLGESLRRRYEREPDERTPQARSTFVEGFVAASLIFCVGPLTVLGSIRDGLQAEPDLLLVKSALDGLVAVVLAATLGWGVAFAALTVLVYQGGLTLAAGLADDVLSTRMVAELTSTGGMMIIGIGLRLLDLQRVRVASFLPGLVIAPVLVALFAR